LRPFFCALVVMAEARLAWRWLAVWRCWPFALFGGRRSHRRTAGFKAGPLVHGRTNHLLDNRRSVRAWRWPWQTCGSAATPLRGCWPCGLWERLFFHGRLQLDDQRTLHSADGPPPWNFTGPAIAHHEPERKTSIPPWGRRPDLDRIGASALLGLPGCDAPDYLFASARRAIARCKPMSVRTRRADQ